MLKEFNTNKCQRNLQKLQWKRTGNRGRLRDRLRDEIEVELYIVVVKSW
jgi:hypothetical protein